MNQQEIAKALSRCEILTALVSGVNVPEAFTEGLRLITEAPEFYSLPDTIIDSLEPLYNLHRLCQQGRVTLLVVPEMRAGLPNSYFPQRPGLVIFPQLPVSASGNQQIKNEVWEEILKSRDKILGDFSSFRLPMPPSVQQTEAELPMESLFRRHTMFSLYRRSGSRWR